MAAGGEGAKGGGGGQRGEQHRPGGGGAQEACSAGAAVQHEIDVERHADAEQQRQRHDIGEVERQRQQHRHRHRQQRRGQQRPHHQRHIARPAHDYQEQNCDRHHGPDRRGAERANNGGCRFGDGDRRAARPGGDAAHLFNKAMQPRRVPALRLGAHLHAHAPILHAPILHAPVARQLGRQLGQRHRPGLERQAQPVELGRQEAGQRGIGSGELGVRRCGQDGERRRDAVHGIAGLQTGQHALDLGARGLDRQAQISRRDRGGGGARRQRGAEDAGGIRYERQLGRLPGRHQAGQADDLGHQRQGAQPHHQRLSLLRRSHQHVGGVR